MVSLPRDSSGKCHDRGKEHKDPLSWVLWIIVLALAAFAIAGMWDNWWHGAYGRDSFWELPHLVMYGGILVAIVGGVISWVKTGIREWRGLVMSTLALLLAAPVDNLWHSLFGKEDATTPLIFWSPGHAWLAASFVVILLSLLRLLRPAGAWWSHALSALVWAEILAAFWVEASPLRPFGTFALLGLWGAGVDLFLFAGVLLLAQRKLATRFAATRIAVSFVGLRIMVGLLALASLLVSTPSAGTIWSHLRGDRAHSIIDPPAWALLLSFVLPAAVLDLSTRVPTWARGGLAGAITGTFLYSPLLFSKHVSLGISQFVIAGASCLCGGLAAGALHSAYQADRYYKTHTITGGPRTSRVARVEPFGAPGILP